MLFYITFGQRYRQEEHPVFGYEPRLPDSWVEIEAEDMSVAHAQAFTLFGPNWSMLYSTEDFTPEYFPNGCYRRYE